MLPRGVASWEVLSTMQRFRSVWLAVMGGVLLVTFSLSAAFGAAPASTREGTRGQSIAAYVHELLFGAADEPAEETPNGEETEEDAESDEADDADEVVEEDLDESDEVAEDNDESDEADEESEDVAGAHGECVSEVARDKEAIGGPNENHGGAVSEAARVTCWETGDEEGEDEAAAEEESEDAEEAADEESDVEESEDESHGECVSRVARDKTAIGGAKNNHGWAVSEAARVTCWETEGDDEDEEAAEEEAEVDDAATEADEDGDSAELSAKEQRKADREAAKAERKENHGGKGNGKGNGRGGGRP